MPPYKLSARLQSTYLSFRRPILKFNDCLLGKSQISFRNWYIENLLLLNRDEPKVCFICLKFNSQQCSHPSCIDFLEDIIYAIQFNEFYVNNLLFVKYNVCHK